MYVSRKEPGLIVSAAAHATLLAAALVAFNSPARFDPAAENIPVEMISNQDFSQISKGEKTAKDVKPVQKADRIADKQETKPTPPLAEAKKDVPLPPPPLKRLPDPGEDDEPKKPEPQKMAALPPPRPVEAPKTTPLPPERPQPAKAEPKEQPKDEPADAEPIAPKPPVRPKELKAEAKPAPTPPKPPEKPRLDKDEIAKLLAREKPADKPAARPKSGEQSDEKHNKFDSNAISRLLDHDKPQTTGSTGREVVRTASLGAPTGTATKMSPSLVDALNSWMIEQYTRCYHYFGTGSNLKYIPRVALNLRPDGSLDGAPTLLNPPTDPALASLASAALNAVHECNPLRIPSQFAQYYDQWKSRKIDFDPELMR